MYSGLTIHNKLKKLRNELKEIDDMLDGAEAEYGKSGVTYGILKREYDAKFKELRDLQITLLLR